MVATGGAVLITAAPATDADINAGCAVGDAAFEASEEVAAEEGIGAS